MDATVAKLEVQRAIASQSICTPDPESRKPTRKADKAVDKVETGEIQEFTTLRFRITWGQYNVIRRAMEAVRLAMYGKDPDTYRSNNWQGSALECISSEFLSGVPEVINAGLDLLTSEEQRIMDEDAAAGVSKGRMRSHVNRKYREIATRLTSGPDTGTREDGPDPVDDEPERKPSKNNSKTPSVFRQAIVSVCQELTDRNECEIHIGVEDEGTVMEHWRQGGFVGNLLMLDSDPRDLGNWEKKKGKGKERRRVLVWLKNPAFIAPGPEVFADMVREAYELAMADADLMDEAQLRITEIRAEQQASVPVPWADTSEVAF
jgi:hypothetical protein